MGEDHHRGESACRQGPFRAAIERESCRPALGSRPPHRLWLPPARIVIGARRDGMIIRWSLGAAIVASLVALAGRPVNAAADWPEWAYPVNPPVSAFDATVAKQLPG